METLNYSWTTLIMFMLVCLFCFALGFFVNKPIVQINNNFAEGSIPANLTFDIGPNANKIYNERVDLSVCKDYVDPYYNCKQDLKFENMTGKYCNGTLVCQNKIIGD